MKRLISRSYPLVLFLAMISLGSWGCGTDHLFDRGILGPVTPPLVGDVSFAQDVVPALSTCISCHGGGAGGWTYDGGGNAHDQVMEIVDLASPSASLLLTKPSGVLSHAGGTHYAVGSEAYNQILAWIEAGAADN